MERELEPYGLILKAGVWYLCARVPDGGDDRATHRLYRIDRFAAVVPGAEHFVRDEAFDLPRFWAERAAGFARSILRSEVVLRLSPAGVRRLPAAIAPATAREALDGAGPPDGEGWVRITLPVESDEVAYEQLLLLGAECEVLEPATLRRRFMDTAVRLGALYR